MKKNLLLSMAFVAAMTASAVNLQPVEQGNTFKMPYQNDYVSGIVTATPEAKANYAAKANRAAEGTITFGYCDEPQTATAFNGQAKGNVIRCGAEVKASTATQFAGAKITAINVASGTNNQLSNNPATKVKVFLSYNLAETPFYSQDATLSSTPFAWNKITLDKPYTIEKDKPFFFGYEITVDSEHLTRDCFYVVFDGKPTSSTEGSWTYFTFQGQEMTESMGADYGNICTTIDIEGAKIEANNGILEELILPSAAVAGKEFPFKFTIKNASQQDLKTGEIEIRINNGEATTIPFDLGADAIKYNKGAQLAGQFVTNETGTVKMTVTLTKVNGVANSNTTGTQTQEGTFKVFPEGKGYTRNVVIEEGTGTWCGWCPRGIVLLENARKTYTDGSLICIGVHQGDAMAASTYQDFIANYISGFPAYIISRQYNGNFYQKVADTDNYVKAVYDEIRSIPTGIKITLKAEYADAEKKSINCYTETEVCDDYEGTPYRIAYALIEDKVGPYYQANNYAGGGSGQMNGWENYKAKHKWTYDDVARQIVAWDGVKGSLPATLVNGSVYTHNQVLNIAKGVKPEDCRVVAMLIDTKTGVIENAHQVTIDAPGAVESVLGDNEAVSISGVNGAIAIEGNYTEAIVYNFDGTTATVANGNNMIEMPAGMYIVKVDNVVKKVVVR